MSATKANAGKGTDPTGAEAIRRAHEARAMAELALAERAAPGSDAVASSGAVVAEVALVKGLPGPAESAGGVALSGPDGEAADAALAALGWDPAQVFRTLSRPEPGIAAEKRVRRLRQQLEAVDPVVVIALDAEAAADLAEAFALDGLKPGAPVTRLGRTLVALSGLESSLGDPTAKRRVWRELKAATPPGPVY